MTSIVTFVFLVGVAGSFASPQIRGQIGASRSDGRSVVTQRPVALPAQARAFAPATAPSASAGRQMDEAGLVNIALTRSRPDEPPVIIKQIQDWSPDRGYQYSYETENGIQAYETAKLRNLGQDDVGPVVSGGYSFTGDDGRVYSVTYTADENGFQATGDHLPVPPPIPEAIQRSLDYIRSLPPTKENQQ